MYLAQKLTTPFDEDALARALRADDVTVDRVLVLGRDPDGRPSWFSPHTLVLLVVATEGQAVGVRTLYVPETTARVLEARGKVSGSVAPSGL